MNRGQGRIRRGGGNGGSRTILHATRHQTNYGNVNQNSESTDSGPENHNQNDNNYKRGTGRWNNTSGQQNRNYQPNRGTFNQNGYSRNSGNRNDYSGNGQPSRNNSALWRTAEGRQQYSEKMGFYGTSRNKSSEEPSQQELQIYGGQQYRNNQEPKKQYVNGYNDNNYAFTGDYLFRRGNRRGRQTPQELRPSQLQLATPRNVGTLARPIRTATEDRLGSGDKPGGINAARDLMQEEYEIQAAEYAAKSRENEMKKLQEKMMRLRFCSSFDLGHRLDDRVRDINPGEREKMVERLQQEYNQQSKTHAEHMKEIEKKKEALERAKKLEKMEKSTFFKDTVNGVKLGSLFTPDESTGAIPKQKGSGTSYEKKNKRRDHMDKISEDFRSNRSFSNSLQSTKSNSQTGILNDAVESLTRPSRSNSDFSPSKYPKLVVDSGDSASFSSVKSILQEVLQKTDPSLSKFSPNAPDVNLRKARKRMQEKLDKEADKKKAEEDRRQAESGQKQVPNTENVSVKSDTQKTSVGQQNQKKVTTESTSMSGIHMGLKEVQSIELSGLLVKSEQAAGNNNTVLFLRESKDEDEARAMKAADKLDTLMESIIQEQGLSGKNKNKNEAESQKLMNFTNATSASSSLQMVFQEMERIELPGISTQYSARNAREPKDEEVENKLIDVKNEVKKENDQELCGLPVRRQNQESTESRDGPQKVLSIQEQLRLRATRLNQEYEEQYEKQLKSCSPPEPNHDKKEKLDSQHSNSVRPIHSNTKLVDEISRVPEIRDVNQLNDYDRTGMVPKITEYFEKGKRLFTVEGCDFWGQPILKLRTN